MRKSCLYLLMLLFLLPSCSKSTNSSTRMVKPKYHHRWYDRKKDKRTKRVKSVKIAR